MDQNMYLSEEIFNSFMANEFHNHMKEILDSMDSGKQINPFDFAKNNGLKIMEINNNGYPDLYVFEDFHIDGTSPAYIFTAEEDSEDRIFLGKAMVVFDFNHKFGPYKFLPDDEGMEVIFVAVVEDPCGCVFDTFCHKWEEPKND